MTYRDLRELLDDLEDDQLNMVVMAHIDEEFFKITELGVQDKEGTLADSHPYLDVE